MFGFVADTITSVVSILLPVFATYKALRTRNITTLTLWLIYWTTLALVLLAESQLYFFLRWLPLYSWIRLAMYIYLVAPGQKHGSFYLYKEYIHPFLYRHEAQIDQLINEGNTRAFSIGWELVVKGISFVQAQVTRYNEAVSAANERSFHHTRVNRRRRDPRFEELDSDDFTRPPHTRYIDDHDDGYEDSYQTSGRRRLAYNPRSVYEDEQDYDTQRFGYPYQLAVKDKEDTMIQSALDRIARARAKGKSMPNLIHEENEALERRRSQQPEHQPVLATPPTTPAKQKLKSNSRTNSSSSLAASKAKKPRNSLPAQVSSPIKASNRTKSHRKSSPEKYAAEQALPFAPGTAPSGIMVPGPNGVPVYASLVYDHARNEPYREGYAQSRSPSSSRRNSRDSPPVDYRGYSSPNRPHSANSVRSLPDDIDWHPPRPRYPPPAGGSTSTRLPPPGQYEAPRLDDGTGRRSTISSMEIHYSTVRRKPPSPGLPNGRGASQSAQSDAPLTTPKGSSLRRQVELNENSSTAESDSSDEESSQDTEIEVVVAPKKAKGYTISKTSVAPTPQPSSTRTNRFSKGKRK